MDLLLNIGWEPLVGGEGGYLNYSCSQNFIICWCDSLSVGRRVHIQIWPGIECWIVWTKVCCTQRPPNPPTLNCRFQSENSYYIFTYEIPVFCDVYDCVIHMSHFILKWVKLSLGHLWFVHVNIKVHKEIRCLPQKTHWCDFCMSPLCAPGGRLTFLGLLSLTAPHG
jgi:hypothetical protein